MAESITASAAQVGEKRLAFFERYLSLWVALCMVVGIAIGKLLPGLTAGIRGLEFGEGSQINAPIAVVIWLMITPMMMKVDFSAVRNVGPAAGGAHRHGCCELDRKAVFNGAPRVVLLPPGLLGVYQPLQKQTNTLRAASSLRLLPARRWSLFGAI